ncbi:TPA: hypothetical protein LSH75_004644, partial [Citrobacter koseri]|nr:hypothetical protein [Citrobacter koseri]
VGYTIYIVTDSEFTLKKFKLNEKNFDGVFVFESFSNSYDSVNKGKHDFWNVHSDFERNKYYKSVRGNGDYWSSVSNALHAFFDNIYVDNKIDFIFYENVSNGLAESAMCVGKKYNIRYLGLTSSRLPGRMLFSDDEIELASYIRKLA